MKRFRRWLFNGIAALSLLMCVATAILWMRSHWIGDDWTFQKDRTKNGKSLLFAADASSTTGSVEILIESGIATKNTPDLTKARHSQGSTFPLIFQGMRRTLMERLGFRLNWGPWIFVHSVSAYAVTRVTINFPFWFLVTAFAATPLLWILTVRSRRSASSGFCQSCGYDLRASPDRCPECGAVPVKP
jgi:hypothetical protein